MATMTSKLTFSKSDVEGEKSKVIRVTLHGFRCGSVVPRIVDDLRSAMSVVYDLKNGTSPALAVQKLAEDPDQEYQSLLYSLADVLKGMKFSEIGFIEETSLSLFFDVWFTVD